jgi:uncharacterized membrane protein
MVVAVLALMGLFIAFYLTAHALGWTGPLRCGIGSCETVQSSEWATLGPIPVAAIGLVGYLALLVLAVVGIQPAWRGSGLVGGLLLLGSTLALAYSAFLTYLEAFVIRAWCQWCVTSAILVTIIFLASLPEARRMGGGKKS